MLLSEARVHAEDLRRKQRGLVAASAGADLKDDVLLVIRVLGQQLQLQLFLDLRQPLFKLRQLILRHRANVGIALGEHGLRIRDALLRALIVAEGLDHRLEIAVLLRHLLVALVIVDDLVRGHLAGQLFVAGGYLFQAFKHRGTPRPSKAGIWFKYWGRRRRRRTMAAGAAREECRENG